MKIYLALTIFLLSIAFSRAQLLGANRYDYRNTTNQDFQDLVEFSVCGFNRSSLNDMAALLSQTYLNVRRDGWQRNVKMLFGENWRNGSQFIVGCQDPNQQLQQFAVRAALVRSVIRELSAQKFKQHVSCVDELMMRQYLSDNFGSANNSRRLDIGPKLVRMVFHDSLDFNNLVDANNQTFDGKSGVDFCLYSPFSSNQTKLSDADADPDHNRGLGPSLWFVNVNQRFLAPWVETPDVEVLGALIALEDWFKGPKVNFRFGRRQGVCQKVLCILENCVNQSLFLKNSPSSSQWSNKNNLDVMSAQGLSVKESIALMGAHTIGGVNVCTGFGNLNTGAFCANQSTSGQLDTGSFFDQTPQLFDNNYFKMLTSIRMGDSNSNSNQFPDCGFLQGISRNNPTFFRQNVCQNLQYCNQTAGRKSHLKNLLNVSFTDDGRYRRIVHLPSDWSNLFNEETLRHIREFADDQNEFFRTFSTAYERVSNLGYQDNELFQCQAVSCQLSQDQSSFSCETKFDDILNFQLNGNPECQVPLSVSNCQLVGGYGTSGQIQCGQTLYTCPLTKSIQNNQTIAKFLLQSTW